MSRTSKKENACDPQMLELTTQYEKKIYDLEQLLDISQSFCSTLEFSKLLESIVYICMAQMHVLGAGIFVRNNDMESDEFILETNHSDLNFDPKTKFKIPGCHPIVAQLYSEKRAISLEYLKNQVPADTDLSVIESLHPTLLVPLIQKNNMNGILFLGERIIFDGITDYTEYEKEQIMSIATLASLAINNAALVERSSTDMMTKLKLKYYFFNVLGDKLDAAFVQKTPIAVLMFDIDFFKKFNDTYGHECGDYVLIQVASLIKTGLREEDLASRYGGEEFTVLLDNTPKEQAMLVAERIRSTIENFDFQFNNQHLHVTISGGVAIFDRDLNPVIMPKRLVNQADQGLYMSKNSGRNKITYADPALIKDCSEEFE
ncbi:MAG: diguanylate cyclase DgcA [Treponema sp.]